MRTNPLGRSSTRSCATAGRSAQRSNASGEARPIDPRAGEHAMSRLDRQNRGYTHTMDLLQRIAVDPTVRFGKPCVRGTRITVGDVLGYLAAGMTQDQIMEEFSQLTGDDVRACLAYAAERERRTLTIPAA
jgi:uncharacterized protein (DUF433 family)